MCGRFTLKTPIENVATQFQAAAPKNIEARYNIAPSQEILAVWERGKEREMSSLVWGLIPSWSREPKGIINARAETLLEKPSFREAFKHRRCLIPADGFYEWKKEANGKQPYYFQLKDGELFAFAGIWEEWEKGESAVRTCAIITTEGRGRPAPRKRSTNERKNRSEFMVSSFVPVESDRSLATQSKAAVLRHRAS
jgi:putative SOS response-associated peptidase YedK